MFPVAYELKNSEYKILFRCELCGKEHRNKKAEDEEIVELLKYINTKFTSKRFAL